MTLQGLLASMLHKQLAYYRRKMINDLNKTGFTQNTRCFVKNMLVNKYSPVVFLLKLSITLFAVLLMNSCAHHLKRVHVVDPAEIKLTEAAVSVSHSLRNLAEVQQAANPQAIIKTPPNPNTYGMGGLASVDWSGPIEPFVSRLAAANGYHVRVLGVRPAIPVIVTVNAKDTPMGDILRDAGFQAADHATLVVLPRSRTIEIRYEKP